MLAGYGSFLGDFLLQGGFLLFHPFENACFCRHLLSYRANLSWIQFGLVFSVYFFKCYPSPSSSSCNILYVIYPFCISVMFFLFLYLTPNRIILLICSCLFSTDMLVEFSFVILEGPILFVLFDPFSGSFEHSFFHQYLLIYFFLLCC